jgi:hypothetical protein
VQAVHRAAVEAIQLGNVLYEDQIR